MDIDLSHLEDVMGESSDGSSLPDVVQLLAKLNQQVGPERDTLSQIRNTVLHQPPVPAGI
ncbi:hypothetical protein KIPB_017331, partial [Kipferlia bialata]|eukprot:g17331.t1